MSGMSIAPNVLSLVEMIKKTHDMNVAHFKRLFLGKEVTLLGTFPRISRGRSAVIDNVAIINGEVMFLCMVIRSGTEPEDRDFLNSAAWTRSYWKLDQFVVLE